MAGQWVSIINNVVSKAQLDSELSRYIKIDIALTELNKKLDSSGGTASGLKLTNVGLTDDSAITRSVLNESVTSLLDGINGKISVGGGTFTGPVNVQSPTSADNPVTLQYLQNNYIRASGGTFTGAPRYANTPQSDDELVNRGWVNSVVSTKAEFAVVESMVATKADASALSNYAPLSNADLTGVPQTSTPEFADRSRRIATTEWVKNYVEAMMGGTLDAANH